MRLKVHLIIGTVILAMLGIVIVAVTFRGDYMLQAGIRKNLIVVSKGDGMLLPSINLNSNVSIKVHWYLDGRGIAHECSRTSSEFEIVTNWLGSAHRNAMPSYSDFIPDIGIIISETNSTDHILITILSNSLIVYDIGVGRQYIRTASWSDMKMLWAMNCLKKRHTPIGADQ